MENNSNIVIVKSLDDISLKNTNNIMAGYLRLSRDEDGKNYDSIESQKELIINCYRKILNYNGDIYFFEDDNKSGYNFKREGFILLRQLVLQNKVKNLLFKDLSRFGRNNARTLLYYEEFVDDYEVRLIGVSDNHDSQNKFSKETLGIYTWSNERYVVDISQKIISKFRLRQEKGDLIITIPFGYLKDQEGDIVVDEYSSNIVQEIFDLYISGYGYRKIAEIMEEKKYPTPSRYKNRKDASNIWNFQMIKNILNNEFYKGTLIQMKTYKKKIKGKSYMTPDDKVLRFENHHISIITKEKFNLVQRIIEDRNNNGAKGTKRTGEPMHLFTSKIFCVKCGKAYIYYNRKKSYICGTQFKIGTSYCKNKVVYEDKLLNDLDLFLKQKRKNNQKSLEKIKNFIEQNKENDDINLSIKKLKIQIEQQERNYQVTYFDKLNNKNKILENVFDNSLKQIENELEGLNNQLNKLIEIKNNTTEQLNDLERENELLDRYIGKELTRKDIEMIFEKFEVDDREENFIKVFLRIKDMAHNEV